MSAPKDPVDLLEQFRSQIDSRMCRLFTVACCRRITGTLCDELRSAVDTAELLGQGLASEETRAATYKFVEATCIYIDGDSSAEDRARGFSSEAVLGTLFDDNCHPQIESYAITCAIAVARAVQEVIYAQSELAADSDAENRRLADLERQWQYDFLCRALVGRDTPANNCVNRSGDLRRD